MPVLLNSVNVDGTGIKKKVAGPTTIFIEGDLGGGTVTIYVSRNVNAPIVAAGTYTATGAYVDTIDGTHYICAGLTGSTDAELTVATLGP